MLRRCLFLITLGALLFLNSSVSCAAAVAPAAVDGYACHEDGGLIYDPLRREAGKTGQLERYQNVPVTGKTLTSDGVSVKLTIPEKVHAYDVVPISYELLWKDDKGPRFPLAVAATAFEDETRRRGRDLFDLALPGRIDLKISFLGSITAHHVRGARHNLKADLSDAPKVYPPFRRRPQVRSGVVEAGDLVWFKFRYTNIGDTIIDPEGFGGCQFHPQLLRKNRDGKYVPAGEPYNLYVRDLAYLYPGESRDMWFHCTGSMPGYVASPDNPTPQGFGLVPGEYIYRFRMTFRCYASTDPFLNIWAGPFAYKWDMPFTVEKAARQAPVQVGKTVLTDAGGAPKLPSFLHTFEEFMTSFDLYAKKPEDAKQSISGTLYLQVAPWTKQVVVKVIQGRRPSIKTVALPVSVDSSALDLSLTLNPAACLVRNGLLEPIIASQTMADMRTNVQLGPFPERHIRRRLREMMDCGINMVSTTCMPWLYDDRHRPASNYQGDAFKYVLDVARDEGMRVEGLGTYPYDRAVFAQIASWLTGRPFAMKHSGTVYGAISRAEPLLSEVNASVWRYQFLRWGDLYCQTADGAVPISVEDTWGWMRQDVNSRHPMGEATVALFRRAMKKKYGTIEKVNRAWGTSFSAFDQIAPEKNQVRNRFGHIFEYTKAAHPFHDWNRAVEELDRFRTLLRLQNYKQTLDVIRKTIPRATICLRTEGANVLAAGLDPQDRNDHIRHIIYSQRRCAAIAELIRETGLVSCHADYTTLPYTPSEIRFLTSLCVKQGIVPMWLAQFDNMRDIAINDRYGTDYQRNYRLPGPKKGYMMHTLVALVPWFEAVYESGGIPAILWEDYQCDGFATVTQKREMRLFKEKLTEVLTRPENVKKREAKPPPQNWRTKSRALRSYQP